VNRHFRKLLAIQLNVRQNKPSDELAVAETMKPCRCVQACDPQSTEVAATASSVTIRKSTGTHQVFLSRPV
jgi:hypothetical protein